MNKDKPEDEAVAVEDRPELKVKPPKLVRMSICVSCLKLVGQRGGSPVRAFDRPFKGTVHHSCMLGEKSYIFLARSKKGSKMKILMGPLRERLLKPVQPEPETAPEEHDHGDDFGDEETSQC